MDEIARYLSKRVKNNRDPSVHYVFFDRERIIQEYIFGHADLVGKIPADKRTTYHWYSITKTFTALAVLQLCCGKSLGLDMQVAGLLQDFPYSREITLRHILTHTSGIPNPVPLSWIHPAGEHHDFDPDKFFSGVFRRHNKARSNPGDRFMYSNLGYVLLGKIIEIASGLNYEEYIRGKILRQLNLGPADLDFEIIDIKRHATGYHNTTSLSYQVLGFLMDRQRFMDAKTGRWRVFRPFYVNGPSYGGLVGTVDSLVRYLQDLLKPNSLLLSEEWKRSLFTENLNNNGKATGMCLSWFKGEHKGVIYYTHAGGGGGYYGEARLYPDQGFGSVIMFNRSGMKDERFLDKIDHHFLPV